MCTCVQLSGKAVQRYPVGLQGCACTYLRLTRTAAAQLAYTHVSYALAAAVCCFCCSLHPLPAPLLFLLPCYDACFQAEWIAKSQELHSHMGTLLEQNKLLTAQAETAEQRSKHLEHINDVYKEQLELITQKADAGIATAASQKKVRAEQRAPQSPLLLPV